MSTRHKSVQKKPPRCAKNMRTIHLDISSAGKPKLSRRNTGDHMQIFLSPHKTEGPKTSSLHTLPCFTGNSLPITPPRFGSSSCEPSELPALFQAPTENHSICLQIPDSHRFYREHLQETYEDLCKCEELPTVGLHQVIPKQLILRKPHGYEKKNTVIFDLDETLVHGYELGEREPEFVVTFENPEDGAVESLGVSVRPFARACLREAAQNFEVIVFTASQRVYAEQVLDQLDPTNEYIHHRVYREHCLQVGNSNVKDLRIFLGRHLKSIIIVDNSCVSFSQQLDNGVPIISWKANKGDRELLHLMNYLKTLAEVPDVRENNRRMFRLITYCEDFAQGEGAHTWYSQSVNLRLDRALN